VFINILQYVNEEGNFKNAEIYSGYLIYPNIRLIYYKENIP